MKPRIGLGTSPLMILLIHHKIYLNGLGDPHPKLTLVRPPVLSVLAEVSCAPAMNGASGVDIVQFSCSLYPSCFQCADDHRAGYCVHIYIYIHMYMLCAHECAGVVQHYCKMASHNFASLCLSMGPSRCMQGNIWHWLTLRYIMRMLHTTEYTTHLKHYEVLLDSHTHRNHLL